MTKRILIGDVSIGGSDPVVLIAGPCVIESEASAMRHARLIRDIAARARIPLIYKSSYDKANRTSIKSFRGPGLKKGLRILKKIKDELGLPILSDVHCKEEIDEARKVLDVIQIPAFLSRQTDLITAAAKTGKVINIKKAQFLAPWDVENIIKKVESCGNKNIILTERGTSFGYNNLVSDFRSIIIMKRFGYPVVYDATHSVQIPGGLKEASGGDREFIGPLSMAGCACGADGIFIEVHEAPDKALSDGPNMVRLDELEGLIRKIKAIEKARA